MVHPVRMIRGKDVQGEPELARANPARRGNENQGQPQLVKAGPARRVKGDEGQPELARADPARINQRGPARVSLG